jgi:hypothetical protein
VSSAKARIPLARTPGLTAERDGHATIETGRDMRGMVAEVAEAGNPGRGAEC